MARALTIRPVTVYRRPLGLTVNALKPWTSSLLFWGVSAGTTVALLLSNTPIFKHDVLIKLPLIGDIWVDKTPPDDKAF